MSLENVKQYFKSRGLEGKVMELEKPGETVELAAQALGCGPQEIAKTMSFLLEEQPILIVVAGDRKVDNKKYKDRFGKKAKMIKWDEVEYYIGHKPGGVGPFAINEGVDVYLDVSLQRFDHVYPAGGSGNSAIKMNLSELEEHSMALGWVDVAKSF